MTFLSNLLLTEDVLGLLIPIGICVVMPVLIVWMAMRARQNETNRKAEIMLKAIENGVDIDTDLFKKKTKSVSIKKDLLDKFNGACITSLMGAAFLILYYVANEDAFLFEFYPIAGFVLLAVGIGLFISYFVGKKMLAKEIEAEEKNIQEPR